MRNNLRGFNPMATDKAKQHPLDWLDWIVAGLVWLAAMMLYVRTLATTVLLGDSGEYQVLASTLGLAHSTGYSIYLLLAKLVTWIPVQDIAYRVNLFSAISAALALGLVYLAGRLLGAGRVAGLLGPIALALVKLFWLHAVIAESYDQAAMGVALILVLVLLWRRTGNTWLLFTAGLAGGLSLAVHNTISLAAPAVLIYLLAARCSRQGWMRASAGAVIGIIMVIASFFALDAINAPTSFLNVSARPNLSAWDLNEDQWKSPFVRFDYLVFARQWRGAVFDNSTEEVNKASNDYFGAFDNQFTLPALAMVLVGAFRLFIPWGRGRPWMWREGLLLGLSWLVIYFYLINYKISDINTYYIPSYVPLAILASVGTGAIFSLVTWAARSAIGALKGNKTPEAGSVLKERDVLTGGIWGVAGSLVGLALVLYAFLPYRQMIEKSWNLGRISFLTADRITIPVSNSRSAGSPPGSHTHRREN